LEENAVKPRPIPELTDRNAKRLVEYAERPLSSVEKESLKKCREVFERHPIK